MNPGNDALCPAPGSTNKYQLGMAALSAVSPCNHLLTFTPFSPPFYPIIPPPPALRKVRTKSKDKLASLQILTFTMNPYSH